MMKDALGFKDEYVFGERVYSKIVDTNLILHSQ